MRTYRFSQRSLTLSYAIFGLLAVSMLAGCGTSSTSVTNKATVQKSTNTTTNAVPGIVITDVNALWADDTQLMQDASTSNLSLMSDDITTAKSDYSTAQSDYKGAPKSRALTNSGFSDFLTRYNQFLSTMAKAIEDAKNGNLSDEQAQLSDATKQQSYLQAEYETITGP
jgi:hypothetical protein